MTYPPSQAGRELEGGPIAARDKSSDDARAKRNCDAEPSDQITSATNEKLATESSDDAKSKHPNTHPKPHYATQPTQTNISENAPRGLAELAASWDRDCLLELAVSDAKVVLMQVDRCITVHRSHMHLVANL